MIVGMFTETIKERKRRQRAKVREDRGFLWSQEAISTSRFRD